MARPTRIDITSSERAVVKRLLPAFASLITVLPPTFNRVKINDLAKLFANPKNWQYFSRKDPYEVINLFYRQIKLLRLSPLSESNVTKRTKFTKPALHNPPVNITTKAKAYWPKFWLKRSETDSRHRQYKNIILNSAKQVERSGYRHFPKELDRLKYIWAVAIIIFSRSCLKHKVPFVEHRKKLYQVDPRIVLAKALKDIAPPRNRKLFTDVISRVADNYAKTGRLILPKF